MELKSITHLIGTSKWLRSLGLSVSAAMHRWILQGGHAVRRAVDLLHGVWLGHPLHPVLTDLVVGAWSLGAVFDSLSLFNRSRAIRESADRLDEIGTALAVPTAVSGLADFSGIKRDSVEFGTLHGLTNASALTLHLLSVAARRNGNRGLGISLASLGTLAVGFGGWLGGELVFRLRVGVDHNAPVRQPEEWTAVLGDAELAYDEPRRVEVAGRPVLLYRHNGSVFAISARCAHAGGPLDEGTFEGTCVTCPWHQSVYDMRDGSIVHGPTAFPQPAYLVRLRDGQIELRADVPTNEERVMSEA